MAASAIIQASLSVNLEEHITHSGPSEVPTLKQKPSLKLPKSERPPVYPFLVLIIGLISAMVSDLAVLANLLRLDDKAYNPL